MSGWKVKLIHITFAVAIMITNSECGDRDSVTEFSCDGHFDEVASFYDAISTLYELERKYPAHATWLTALKDLLCTNDDVIDELKFGLNLMPFGPKPDYVEKMKSLDDRYKFQTDERQAMDKLKGYEAKEQALKQELDYADTFQDRWKPLVYNETIDALILSLDQRLAAGMTDSQKGKVDLLTARVRNMTKSSRDEIKGSKSKINGFMVAIESVISRIKRKMGELIAMYKYNLIKWTLGDDEKQKRNAIMKVFTIDSNNLLKFAADVKEQIKGMDMHLGLMRSQLKTFPGKFKEALDSK